MWAESCESQQVVVADGQHIYQQPISSLISSVKPVSQIFLSRMGFVFQESIITDRSQLPDAVDARGVSLVDEPYECRTVCSGFYQSLPEDFELKKYIEY